MLLRSVQTLEGPDKDDGRTSFGNGSREPEELKRLADELVSIHMVKIEAANSNREREHAERMLKRAQRQRARAEKLVAKWQTKIANLDREGVAAVQPRLWPEESATGISSLADS